MIQPIPSLRDISILRLSGQEYLLIACDSCGAIGQKEKDLVRVSPAITGYYTCRVATLEILAAGGQVHTVIDTLSVEWDPTGKEIYQGIQRFLAEAALETTTINGSTEENFPTVQTAMGITVLGTAHEETLRLHKSQPKDEVWVLGLPKIGNEIAHPFDPEVASVTSIQALLQDPKVTAMIPVGSKGISHEASLLAKESELEIEWEPELAVSLEKSAGPATCVVLSMDPHILPAWKKQLASEVFWKLGRMKGEPA